MRTPADLSRYIVDHGIEATLVMPRHDTPTVSLAAQALDCAEDQIVKSVLFVIRAEEDERVAVVITNGVAPVDYRKLAGLFGVNRKRIRLARPEVVLARTGYPAGGVPPFGYPAAIVTLVDRSVLQQPVVYGGGGDEHTLLRIVPAELVRACGATIVDVQAKGDDFS
jgi:prolyl-tRNA editing enzyme YbaK/EbsC (Cys-tRNA(Pro) deacylase)